MACAVHLARTCVAWYPQRRGGGTRDRALLAALLDAAAARLGGGGGCLCSRARCARGANTPPPPRPRLRSAVVGGSPPTVARQLKLCCRSGATERRGTFFGFLRPADPGAPVRRRGRDRPAEALLLYVLWSWGICLVGLASQWNDHPMLRLRRPVARSLGDIRSRFSCSCRSNALCPLHSATLRYVCGGGGGAASAEGREHLERRLGAAAQHNLI